MCLYLFAVRLICVQISLHAHQSLTSKTSQTTILFHPTCFISLSFFKTKMLYESVSPSMRRTSPPDVLLSPMKRSNTDEFSSSPSSSGKFVSTCKNCSHSFRVSFSSSQEFCTKGKSIAALIAKFVTYV